MGVTSFCVSGGFMAELSPVTAVWFSPSRFHVRSGTRRVGLRNAYSGEGHTFLGSVAGGMTTHFILYFLEGRW